MDTTTNPLDEARARVAELEAAEAAFARAYYDAPDVAPVELARWRLACADLRAAYDLRDELEPVAYQVVAVAFDGKAHPQLSRPVYSKEEADEALRGFQRLDGGATRYYYEVRAEVRS
jgi:hypothetical protein